MAPATITPTKSNKAATTSVTIATSKLAGDRILFDAVLAVQDLHVLAHKIFDILDGDDERAKTKVKKEVKDLLKGLSVVDSYLRDTVKKKQMSFLCERYISSKRSETTAAIKRCQATVEPSKRKNPADFRIKSLIADVTNPPKKKSKKANKDQSAGANVESKIAAFIASLPPSNGTHYDMHELVTALMINEHSTIYNIPASKVYDHLNPLGMIVCENCRIGYWIQHMDELDETSTLLAQKIHSRLPQFLRNRLKATLQTHWVWDSFVELFLKRISCLVVLCNQHSQCIQTTSTRDSLLNCNLEMFPIIQGESEVLDGCYVASDSKRGWLIRAGMAERTFSKRWKEHVAASMRASVDTMYRNLYWFYPHKNVMQTVPGRKGVFQDLQQRMGLGMTRGDRNKVLNLFNWSEQLESRLSKLSYGQDRAALLDWKKYRNVCYMFELFFAVAMKESDNITQNPTCEWQLQLYSKNG
jgi:hypothetical protein